MIQSSLASNGSAKPQQFRSSRSVARDVRRTRLEPDMARALLTEGGTIGEAARALAESLLAEEIVLVELGALAWSPARTRQVARQLCSSILLALHDARRRELSVLPEGLRLEIHRPQATFVPPGLETRSLVPHHDGGHSSYLTPSLLDDPGWDPQDRRFAALGHCEYSTPTQKVYQGLFVAEQGAAHASITFFPLLEVLADGFERAVGRTPALSELIAWYGLNLRGSLRSRSEHGGAYPTLAGFVGSTRSAYLGFSPHCAESPLNEATRARFPEFAQLSEGCVCGRCAGEAGRVFCNMLADVSGRSWLEFQRQYQAASISTHTSDLVLWDNLTHLHAGFGGSRERVLEPISFVVDEPSGPSYEAWLHVTWRKAFAAATARACTLPALG